MAKPEYKKEPLKIGVKAAITKVYESSEQLVTTLSVMHPAAAPFLTFAYYSFGGYLAYNQEALNDFTEFLMKHYKELGIDFNSHEFQDAVFLQLETYFKLRIKDKKYVAEEIFLHFCGGPNKPNFPLERYNDTLSKISEEGLQYLAFLRKDIFPLRDADFEHKYETGNYPPPPQGKSKESWTQYYLKHEPTGNYVDKWLSDVYPSTVDVSKVTSAKEEYRQIEVERKRDALSDLSLEMEQLGIMRSYNVGGTIGGGGNVYTLSPYGLKFIEFIPRTI